MIYFAESKDKSPEQYLAVPGEFSDKELRSIRESIADGRTIDGVLSEERFSKKAISFIRGINRFDNTQYIQGAYFRVLQAKDVVDNTPPTATPGLCDVYVVFHCVIGDLKKGFGLQIPGLPIEVKPLDEVDIGEIHENLKENL